MLLEDNLREKLILIRKVFNTSKILSINTNPKQIARYYYVNRLAYWFFVSRDGFVHMGLSESDTLQPGDINKSAKEISEYIAQTGAKEVLELAAGKGGNLQYLSQKNPEVSFYGMDLKGGQAKKRYFRKKPNVFFSFGDYHDLHQYASNSKDIVFIIEALCHAQPKQKVINEVYRVLKPGGSFIIYDGYNLKRYSDMIKDEAETVKLVWKGMLVNPNDMFFDDFKTCLKNEGFKIIKDVDLGQAILPSLRNLENPAKRFFKRPLVAKIINRLLPTYFTANAISGYMLPFVVKNKLCTYNLTIAKK